MPPASYPGPALRSTRAVRTHFLRCGPNLATVATLSIPHEARSDPFVVTDEGNQAHANTLIGARAVGCCPGDVEATPASLLQ